MPDKAPVTITNQAEADAAQAALMDFNMKQAKEMEAERAKPYEDIIAVFKDDSYALLISSLNDLASKQDPMSTEFMITRNAVQAVQAVEANIKAKFPGHFAAPEPVEAPLK